MASNVVATGADDGGDDRAEDRTEESAPGKGPKRGPIQRPGSGSPGGMYGPHVGSLEVMDLMAELAQSHPDARIHLDVMGADGVKRAARTYSVTSFDFDTVASHYGAGEYRVRVQQLGEPKPVRMFRFIAASQSNPTPPIPPQSPPPAPAPQYAPPPPPYYPQQVQGYPYPPPQAPQADGLMAMMMNMAVESAKSQALMMNTLLAKLIEQRTTPQEPAKITELEAMIKLADKLGNRRNGGGRDEGGGDADMLASIAGALKNILPPAAPTPAAAPPRRKLVKLPPKLIPTKHAGSAALPGVAPQAVPQPVSDRPPLAEDGDSHAAPSSDGATPPAGQEHQASNPPSSPAPPATDATPLDPMTAAFVQGMRTNPDARRLAKLILVDDGDDAEALGVMAAALLDDDQAQAMRAATPGQWTRLFVLAFPALDKAKKVELVGAVESAIRDQLADDDAGDDQGDAGDDEGDDDDDDTSDEEGTDRA